MRQKTKSRNIKIFHDEFNRISDRHTDSIISQLEVGPNDTAKECGNRYTKLMKELTDYQSRVFAMAIQMLN